MKKRNIKKYKGILYPVITLIVLAGLLYIAMNLNTVLFGVDKNADRAKCPYKIEGNLDANFVIKYIDSPYCIWCWFEEPVLKKLVKEKGNSFRLEKYDIDHCYDMIRQYRFSGTPSFVFSLKNETKEYTHMGYIGEDDFFNIICEAAGDC